MRIELMPVAIFKMLTTRKKGPDTRFLEPGESKICSGPALRAIFKILAEPHVSFVMICIRNTYSIWLVETVS